MEDRRLLDERQGARPVDCLVSVIVPAYNEGEVLSGSVARVVACMESFPGSWEMLIVDDGSTDCTPSICRELSSRDERIRFIQLSRNCGHGVALTAGYRFARGKFLVSIDADLQDPPELISSLLETAVGEGVEVVYGVRTDRSADSRLKRWSAGAFYRLIRIATGVPVIDHVADFRLITKRVFQLCEEFPERRRVYRLLVPSLNLPSRALGYERKRRTAGRSKYGLGEMVKLAIDSLMMASDRLAQRATIVGVLGSIVGVIVAVLATVSNLVVSNSPGWTSGIVVVSAYSSVQFFLLALMSHLLSLMIERAEERPTFIVAARSAE